MALSTTPRIGDAPASSRTSSRSVDPPDASDATPTLEPPSLWLQRGSLIALLIGTAVLYLLGLSASGYANSFYSAAAQAGSESWRALFFGSLDASNAITVDKPPAALWLMAISVRIFGLNSWSILAPQALLGVGTVGVLYASIRRTAGHWPAILGGVLLALTPAATLMFRFNNPDALLVFLLTLATYYLLRATEKASGRWLTVAGVIIGFGFLTKMLQAFLVLPVFVLVYMIAAPTTVKKRLLHLLAAFGAMIVSLSWWVAIVEIVPESWRPYIGGSQTNSVLELIFGYNGFGRITGNETGSVTAGGGGAGGGATGGGMWGSTGITRLFDGVSGGMIAWLIPAALILAICAMVMIGRRVRTDRSRAAILVWAGWLVVTGLVFSFMAGIYHDYYTVALAPAIAATVALAGTVLWRRRDRWLGRIGLALTTVATTGWAVVLLNRAEAPYDSLAWLVGAAGLVATIGLLVTHLVPRALASAVLAVALLAGITGPAAYALNTAMTPHAGSIVTAGPVSDGGPGGGMRGGPGGAQPPNQNGAPQNGGPQGGAPQGRGGGQPDGNGQQSQRNPQRTRVGGAGGGGMGGLVGGAEVSSEMKQLLRAGSSSYTWVAATSGSQSAASYQLATELPVMAIGGFNGSDPSPTLAGFRQLVTSGQIHYYIEGGGGGGQQNGGSNASSEIASWVSENFVAHDVDGTTVYDLTGGA